MQKIQNKKNNFIKKLNHTYNMALPSLVNEDMFDSLFIFQENIKKKIYIEHDVNEIFNFYLNSNN